MRVISTGRLEECRLPWGAASEVACQRLVEACYLSGAAKRELPRQLAVQANSKEFLILSPNRAVLQQFYILLAVESWRAEDATCRRPSVQHCGPAKRLLGHRARTPKSQL